MQTQEQLEAQQNSLAEANIGLVGTFTKRFRRCGLDDNELRSAILWGIVWASRRFDPTRGLAFGTYAGACIRLVVLEDMRTRVRADHLDRDVVQPPDPEPFDPEESRRLHGAVGQLPERWQGVIQMRIMEDRPRKYAARMLSITPKRCQEIEAAAILKLREILSGKPQWNPRGSMGRI